MTKGWRVKKGKKFVGGYYTTKAEANEAARQTAMSILQYGSWKGGNPLMRARKVRVVRATIPKALERKIEHILSY